MCPLPLPQPADSRWHQASRSQGERPREHSQVREATGREPRAAPDVAGDAQAMRLCTLGVRRRDTTCRDETETQKPLPDCRRGEETGRGVSRNQPLSVLCAREPPPCRMSPLFPNRPSSQQDVLRFKGPGRTDSGQCPGETAPTKEPTSGEKIESHHLVQTAGLSWLARSPKRGADGHLSEAVLAAIRFHILRGPVEHKCSESDKGKEKGRRSNP